VCPGVFRLIRVEAAPATEQRGDPLDEGLENGGYLRVGRRGDPQEAWSGFGVGVDCAWSEDARS
jgi:hypothetical protein